ncbi:MAG TPA: aminopeptidase P family protein, partial [Actinomycetota bacterium]|nr:aminopeptidase P family protein [Actinomycetota bacterium]
TVEARVPLTVEPGIYLPDRGGVRIEDTLVVFDHGVEILTDFPRDLARVG